MKPLRSVIVLGGGTAGFLAAAALRTKMPDLPVRLIRSKDIGIIGVGEGTTVGIQGHLFSYLKQDIAEFYREVKPIWKLGIHYIWGSRPSFNFTFAQNMTLPTPLPRALGYYCHADMSSTSLESALISQKRAFRRDPKTGLPYINRCHAYHLENRIFVEYLEKVARRLGVDIVEDKVIGVEQGEQGVERLRMESGRIETADLFVDCSGFASELLGKAMAEPYDSYRSSLFCDRAVVGGWKRGLGELIQPYTTAETMDAGWSWRIDHEHQINRGYVYSSSFISDEEAETEFRRKNPKVQQTRMVKFRSGRYQRSWVKNVVAIGNAGGFVEPLEATAINAICEQTVALASGLSVNRRFGPKLISTYCARDARHWDAIRRFLAVHYKFNTRLDTQFWREARQSTDLAGAEELVDYYLENGPDPMWAETLVDIHDQFGIEGYLTMLVGQQVPYRHQHQTTPAEEPALHQLREQNRRTAAAGYHAEHALTITRMPHWQWDRQSFGSGDMVAKAS
jgi:tryptophan halogenase